MVMNEPLYLFTLNPNSKLHVAGAPRLTQSNNTMHLSILILRKTNELIIT